MASGHIVTLEAFGCNTKSYRTEYFTLIFSRHAGNLTFRALKIVQGWKALSPVRSILTTDCSSFCFNVNYKSQCICSHYFTFVKLHPWKWGVSLLIVIQAFLIQCFFVHKKERTWINENRKYHKVKKVIISTGINDRWPHRRLTFSGTT